MELYAHYVNSCTIIHNGSIIFDSYPSFFLITQKKKLSKDFTFYFFYFLFSKQYHENIVEQLSFLLSENVIFIFKYQV